VTITGAKVTAAIPTLQSGKGYKLYVSAGTFKDLAGNALDGFDGAQEAAGRMPQYLLQQTAATDSVGPAHLTASNALSGSTPAHGQVMVPPSSTVQIQFDAAVQAGGGTTQVDFGGGLKVYSSDCFFSGSEMTCDPTGDFASGTTYSVAYTTGAVKDANGNTLIRVIDGSNTKLSFTTIDLDYTPPALAASSGTSYARRLKTTPVDPTNGKANVAKGTLLSLTFSETVQAGAGSLAVKKCTTLTSCAATSATASDNQNIDVAGSTAATKLYFSGSSVYIDRTDLADGTRYTVTANPGVFKDTSNQPNAAVTGFEFVVIPDDDVNPSVVMRTPKDDSSTADDAPSSDVTLYFNEGVQAAVGKLVTVKDGTTTDAIPVDNTNPLKGSVSIAGSVATVDPFDDMGFNKIVTVTVEAQAFKDLYGNNIATSTKHFKTIDFNFARTKAHNLSLPFDPREGATLHYTAGQLMLFGGKKGTECKSDLYTSATGKTWTLGESTGGPGKSAYTPSAVDLHGCVWMLGGECDALGAAAGTATIYKTCDAGSTFTTMPETGEILSVPAVGSSGTMEKGQEFPTSFAGHGVAIVGGWQFVVVDGTAGKVWQFLTQKADTVKLISSVPWPTRSSPILLTSSDNKLYLMGGHNCGSDDPNCANVMTDVWMSADAGSTWNCQTANYLDSAYSAYSKGIGQHTSGVMTYDDTVFLLGGHKPNTTQGLNKVYTSYAGPADVTFSATPYAQTPAAAAGAHPSTSVTLYFREALGSAAGIRIRSLGADGAVAGTSANADSDVVIATPTVSRQILTLAPSAALTAGNGYSVIIPNTMVTDTAGNQISSFAAYKFTVNSDSAAPTVSSVAPAGSAVAPWTTVTLTMSEAIVAGTGSITLDSAMGLDVSIPIANATIVDKKAFFSLPVTTPATRLTAGQKYTVKVPAGAFNDLVGNKLAASSANSFTVLSGKVSYAADGYSAANVTEVAAGTGNATSDTVLPTLVSSYPAQDATDVPTSGVSMLMYFSEPVKYNGTGVITIKNGTDHAIGKLNMTTDTASLKLVTNGTKMTLPNVLKKGGTFTVSIPSGVVTDFAGNALSATTTSFTCLGMLADTTAPTVVMVSPTGAAVTAYNTHKVTVWFSEEVETVSGSITIKSSSAGALAASVTSDNVTVSGDKLEMTVYNLALNDQANSFYVQIPAGTLKDKGRGTDGGGIQFQGLNGTTQAFKTVSADVVAPTLSAKHPADEGTSPTYALPVTTSMLLTFTETVQAGSGSVTLTPRYSSPTVTLDVTGSDVKAIGSTVVVTPSTNLMPGEVYAVTVSAGGVKDGEGNNYAGLATGYTVSTAPLIRFKQLAPPVASGLTAGAFWGFGTAASVTTVGADGKRFGQAVAVTPDNTVHVVGGKNATHLASSTAVLNDVWSLSTKRNINCAASYTEKDPASCAAKCTSDTAMGSATTSMTVWRVPSAAGLACKGSDGLPVSSLWGSGASKSETCDCPMCLDPPADPLPINMVNTSYVSSYGLVTANSGKQDLLCRKGFAESDDFTCVVKSGSVYFGEYATYPTCEPLPCGTPPTAPSNAHSMPECDVIASNNTLAHNGTCAVLCAAGYQPATGVGTGKFHCLYGTYAGFDSEPDGTPDPNHVLPTCVPQVCANKPVVAGANTDDCSEAGDILGAVCDVRCDPGYALSGAATMTCAVAAGSAAEAAPSFSTPGSCAKKSCGATPAVDNAEEGAKSDGFTGVLGDTVTLTCKDGYKAVGDGKLTCAAVEAKQEADAAWTTGSFKCEPVKCAAPAAPANGKYECDGDAFGSTCTLVCDAGYSVEGTTPHKCGADEQYAGDQTCAMSACGAPRVGNNMKSTSCGTAAGEGDKCTPECNDGYEAAGTYDCVNGGFATQGACVKPGQTVVKVYYVKAAVTLTLTLPEGSSVADLKDDDKFIGSVKEALGASLGDDVSPADIEILSISEARRLAEAENARRLGSGKLKIDYRIKVASKAAANTLSTKIKTEKAEFEKKFAETLTEKAKDAGLEITVDGVESEDPQVIEEVDEAATAATEAGGDAASEEEGGGSGAIIGGVVGGVAGLALIGGGVVYMKKSKSYASQE
jgi:hypothetical protein